MRWDTSATGWGEYILHSNQLTGVFFHGTQVLILWYGGLLSIEGKDGLTPGRLITFQVHVQSHGCDVDL